MAMMLGPSSESVGENSKVEGVNEFRQVGSSGKIYVCVVALFETL